MPSSYPSKHTVLDYAGQMFVFPEPAGWCRRHTCHQARRSKLDPLDPQGGRKQLLQIVLWQRCVCPDAPTHAHTYEHTHHMHIHTCSLTHIHTQAHTFNKRDAVLTYVCCRSILNILEFFLSPPNQHIRICEFLSPAPFSFSLVFPLPDFVQYCILCYLQAFSPCTLSASLTMKEFQNKTNKPACRGICFFNLMKAILSLLSCRHCLED